MFTEYPPTPKVPPTPQGLGAKQRKRFRKKRRHRFRERVDEERGGLRDEAPEVRVGKRGREDGLSEDEWYSESAAKARRVDDHLVRAPSSHAEESQYLDESDAWESHDYQSFEEEEVTNQKSNHARYLTSEAQGPPEPPKNAKSQITHIRFASSGEESSDSESSGSESWGSDTYGSEAEGSEAEGSELKGSGSDGSDSSDSEASDQHNDENEDPNPTTSEKSDPVFWWKDEIQRWFRLKAHNTKKRYTIVMKSFMKFLQDKKVDASDVKKVTLEHMQMWIQSMTGASNNQKRNCIMVIKSFWKDLYAHVSINHNWALALRAPSRDQSKITNKYMTKQQVTLFLKEARTTNVHYVGIFGFMYFAGLRVAEVCALKKDDVVAEKKSWKPGQPPKTKMVVHVRAEAAKGSCIRRVIVGRTGMKYMLAQVEHLKMLTSNGYLFPGRSKDPDTGECTGKRGVESIYKIVKKFSRRKHINMQDVTPHWFRHAFATHARERGTSMKAISKALGHKSTKTTEIYIQTGEEAGDY